MNKKIEERSELPVITAEDLRKMAQTDIRTVNKEELVDINDVKINTDLPYEERVLDYLRQIKNPYCYLDHGMIIKISFSGERCFGECLNVARP